MTKARDLANASTALSAVSATELAFVDGVTSAIQTQMDAKAPSSTAVTLTGTQTLTNKTLTSPVISSVINNTLTSTTGDIIYASAANTPARLGIGTTGQVLNVASGLPAWSTPASGGGMTSIASGSLSGSSLSLTSISQDYKNLQLILRDFTFSATITNLKGTVNSNTAYTNTGNYSDNSTAGTFAYSGISWMQLSECTMAAAQTDSALIINFYDYTDTTAYKLFDSYSHTIQSNSNNFGTKISGAARTTSAISSITVTLVGGTFSTGTYTLYGVK